LVKLIKEKNKLNYYIFSLVLFFNLIKIYLFYLYLIKAGIAKLLPDLKSLIYKKFYCSYVVAGKSNELIYKTNKLNPYYVTGFTDGEGCFLINIRPNIKLKTGYSVELVFKIALHSKGKLLLTNIKNYFEVGTITERTDGYIQY